MVIRGHAMTDRELKVLADLIEGKRREIQARGLCEWRYQIAPRPGWVPSFAAWCRAQWGE